MSMLSIGNSALQAAYVALRTTGHNIGNVATPGYKRQEAEFGTLGGQYLGGQYVGNGSQIVDVRRVYNEFLTGQAHSANATAHQTSSYYQQMSQLAGYFTNTETSVGASVDELFKSMQALSQRPGDLANRQALLATTKQMTSRFNELAGQVSGLQTGVEKQLAQEVDKVNRLTTQIADLNERIALARGSGRSPNDLLDQRDQAIRDLNGSLRVSVAEQDDGSVNVFLANGQALVVGQQAETLALTRDARDPGQMSLALKNGNQLIALPNASINGGAIAGLMQFAVHDIPAAQNELGRLAVGLAMSFNEQHRLGLTPDGRPGGDFFTLPAGHAFAQAGASAGASVSMRFADASQLMASDYEILGIDDGAGGVAYQVTRLSDGKSLGPLAGPTLSVDGLEIDVAGAVGDRFTVQPYRNAGAELGVAIQRPEDLATAGAFEARLPNTNQGALTIGAIEPTGPLSAAQLAVDYSLAFDGVGGYTLTGSDGSSSTGSYTPGAAIEINFPGGKLTLTGTPAAGDQVQFGKNTSTEGDGRNAIALAQLADKSMAGGGKLGTLYSSIVARVGSDAAGAKIFAEAGLAVFKDAIGAESSVSGVNLDEEAAKLIAYQQQYAAAAKVIATGQAMFDTVLSIGR